MASLSREAVETLAGGALLGLSTLVVSVSGFIFWLLVTRIAGVEAVGSASAAISAAAIAATIAGAGLNIAATREAAASRGSGFTSSALVALALSLPAALIALALASLLGLDQTARALVLVYCCASLLAQACLGSLSGLGLFGRVLGATVAGSVAKIAVGVLLALAGLGYVAALAGCTVYPILVSVASLTAAASLLARPTRHSIARVLRLTAGNYLFAFSGQLLVMLNVYLYALLGRSMAGTGSLYISLMACVVLAGLTGQLAIAALSVTVRRGRETFRESLHAGLLIATPFVVLAALAPDELLSLISPRLGEDWMVLVTLLASVPALAIATVYVSKLNAEQRVSRLAVIGATRVAVLLVLLPPLVKALDVVGAAAAFTLSALAVLPLARSLITPRILSMIAIQYAAIAAGLLGFHGLGLALACSLASILLLHVAKVARIPEVVEAVRLVASRILGEPA